MAYSSWEEIVELRFVGDADDDKALGKLGDLIDYICGLPVERRVRHTLIRADGEVIDNPEILRLAASETFRVRTAAK